MPKNICIIQVRLGSIRLPGKVLKKIGDKCLLEYEIDRVKQAKKIDKIVIATTLSPEDEKIEELCDRVGVDCFRGSENDVLGRYFQCAQKYSEYENIIRITGDCPLIDPAVIDQIVEIFEKNNCDYASNVEVETFPDGMDAEVFKKSTLGEAAEKAKLASEREHVTPYIRKNAKLKMNLTSEVDFSEFRLTVDNQEDFEVIDFLIKTIGPEKGYKDYVSVLVKHPEIRQKNLQIKRNEGYIKSLKEDKIL